MLIVTLVDPLNNVNSHEENIITGSFETSGRKLRTRVDLLFYLLEMSLEYEMLDILDSVMILSSFHS